MYLLLAIMFYLAQAESLPEKWHCGETSDFAPDKQITRLKPREMNQHVVTCKTPRLSGNVDAKGTVVIEVVVNAAGDVECLRAISGHPIIRGAAVEAAKRWKFKPLIVGRAAKPFWGFIAVYVSWDAEEMDKHCPTHGNPSSSGQRSARIGSDL
jgi:TonB family protein